MWGSQDTRQPELLEFAVSTFLTMQVLCKDVNARVHPPHTHIYREQGKEKCTSCRRAERRIRASFSWTLLMYSILSPSLVLHRQMEEGVELRLCGEKKNPQPQLGGTNDGYQWLGFKCTSLSVRPCVDLASWIHSFIY